MCSVCVWVSEREHLPACIYCMWTPYRWVSALCHSWKQSTVGDVTHAVHCSLSSLVPWSLSATQLSILTGSRGEELWGICALSCQSQKWPGTTFKVYALDFRTAQLSWALGTLWAFVTCVSTLWPSRCSQRPINLWNVITASIKWCKWHAHRGVWYPLFVQWE